MSAEIFNVYLHFCEVQDKEAVSYSQEIIASISSEELEDCTQLTVDDIVVQVTVLSK